MQYFYDLKPIEKLFILTLSSSTNSDKEMKLINKFFHQVGEKNFWNFSKNEFCESIPFYKLSHYISKDVLSNKWNIAANNIEKKIKLYLAEVEKIAIEFDKFDIPLIALKNTGIAIGIYKNLSQTPMGDVDLLINQNQFENS